MEEILIGTEIHEIHGLIVDRDKYRSDMNTLKVAVEKATELGFKHSHPYDAIMYLASVASVQSDQVDLLNKRVAELEAENQRLLDGIAFANEKMDKQATILAEIQNLVDGMTVVARVAVGMPPKSEG